jgi:hypothetical protein
MANREKHIKSKKRVTDHGEVFTPEWVVNDMLDLVKQETERIDSRFLEPACGTGNFLVEVLRRKLTVVEKRYQKNQLEFERYGFVAISSIYGIDLLQDNVDETIDRLFEVFRDKYYQLYKKSIKDDYLQSIKFVLSRNIICGDALTLTTVGLTKEPIIFSEWALIFKNKVQRRDFKMKNLLESQPMEGLNLFSDLGEDAFIPEPIKTFPLQNLYKLGEDVQTEL